MPSKKRKFNARFPTARIKRIMQSDDDVGKVAATVPVVISRVLELFIEALLVRANRITASRNAKVLTPSHVKQAVLNEKQFDFLKDVVASIPDIQQENDDSDTERPVKSKGRPKKKPGENGGKPKKQKVMKSQAAANAACAMSESEDSENEEAADEVGESESEDDNGGHTSDTKPLELTTSSSFRPDRMGVSSLNNPMMTGQPCHSKTDPSLSASFSCVPKSESPPYAVSSSYIPKSEIPPHPSGPFQPSSLMNVPPMFPMGYPDSMSQYPDPRQFAPQMFPGMMQPFLDPRFLPPSVGDVSSPFSPYRWPFGSWPPGESFKPWSSDGDKIAPPDGNRMPPPAHSSSNITHLPGAEQDPNDSGKQSSINKKLVSSGGVEKSGDSSSGVVHSKSKSKSQPDDDYDAA